MEALAATTMCGKLPACPLMGSEGRVAWNARFSVKPQASKSMSLSMSLHFADQSHMMFYTRALSCKKDKQAHKDLLLPCNASMQSGTPFTVDVDDGSVEVVIKELEALQMRVKAKKRELEAKKKKMKKPKAKMCNKSRSSSESSESSDDECGMDMDMLRKEMQARPSVGNCSRTENSGEIDIVASTVESGELKVKKKKMKKTKEKVCNKSRSSSESSVSSDDECGMDMDMLRKEMQARPSVSNCSKTEDTGVIDIVASHVESGDLKAKPVAQTAVACAKVEVCIGGKCSKNGSRQVLAAFQDNIPRNSTVVATSCKCMGKCDRGPNVRVQKGPESNPLVYSHVAPQDVETLLQQLQVGRPPSGLPAVPVMLPSTRTPSTKAC